MHDQNSRSIISSRAVDYNRFHMFFVIFPLVFVVVFFGIVKIRELTIHPPLTFHLEVGVFLFRGDKTISRKRLITGK